MTELNDKTPVLFRVDDIATGSDYVTFGQQVGIPSAEIRYVSAKVGKEVLGETEKTF